MQAPLVEPDTEPSSVLEPTSQQQSWWRKRRWPVLIAAIVLCTLATISVADGTQEGPGLSQPPILYPD